METVYTTEIWSENLNDIIEFKAVFYERLGIFSIHAETENTNEWVCDKKRLSFKHFKKICTEFAQTFIE